MLTPSINRLPSPIMVGITTKRYSSIRPSSIRRNIYTADQNILPCSCFSLVFRREGSCEQFSYFHLQRWPTIVKKQSSSWRQRFEQIRYPLLSRTGFLQYQANKEPSIGRSYAHKRAGQHLGRVARRSQVLLHREPFWCGRSSHRW